MSASLSGTIDRVTFHNPENGYVVLRVEVKGLRMPVTVVGQTPRANAGEFVEAVGTWVDDPDFGKQFKADTIRVLPPSTVEGIEKYLGSGLIKGIGPTYARKIVEVFGARTLDVIDESPTYLKEIKGIGSRRIQQIRESWRRQKAVRDIMVFLQSHGVGTGHAFRIWRTYGDRALEVVKANPYTLAAEVWGIGFPTADQLALKLGFAPDAQPRAQAVVRHLLGEKSGEGHVAFPEAALLHDCVQATGIAEPILREAAAALVQAGEIIRESALTPEPWLYLREMHAAEVQIAIRLQELACGEHPLPAFDLDKALTWVEGKIGLALAHNQREAIRQACTAKVLVITGGPGVGKTTLVRGILEIFAVKELRCALAAPTGRAAKRLSESTGREAKTIHRLLEYDHGGPKRNANNPLDVDLLIIDETSMVDVPLMQRLTSALPAKTCLILVGDADQLPSVGPGSVLADVIASKAVPVVRLTEIFRQAQQSGIVRAAYRVHDGEMPETTPAGALGDFYIIEAETPAAILERVLTLVRERIPSRFKLDPFRDVQVLAPMNRGDLGVRNLNLRLQAVLNAPDAQESPEVARFGWSFRVGDKVLQTRNDYQKEVFNGDVGRISKIDVDEQEMTVEFDGRAVTYEFDDLDELSLAYALTVHKSQGSEYPAVVIPLHTQHYLLLQRNVLYTALTRGRKLVVLVGNRKAIQMAISRADVARRYSALKQRLQAQG
ncbi:MAG: ATP-dependent RecD-like DNA helicase [Gemmataceae bacterium]|nr:ATP-dependent RecD-like DNA helicase [Gemmataceae bacterium]